MQRSSVILVLAMLALPAAAQQQPAVAPASNTANASVMASQAVWRTMTRYVTQSAEQMPEADYAYRPVESVRTFGQIIAHVAGAQHMFCAIALGETPPAEDAVEQTATTKEQILQALRESTEHCQRAYAQSDAEAAGMVDLFGAQRSRLTALNLNAAHNGEHYGNLVTYLRIKGMVPPSSQQ